MKTFTFVVLRKLRNACLGISCLFTARFLPCVSTVASVLLVGYPALAQNGLITPTAQAVFYPAPPAGFVAVNATDTDLAKYGFPRRPVPTDQSYETWVKMVATAKTPVPNPIARTTNVVHKSKGRGVAAPPQGGSANTIQNYDSAWSGVEVEYPYAYFAAGGSTVITSFQAPNIGTENCDYGPYKMSAWAGFDGDPGNDLGVGGYDVLQAGVTTVACPASTYPWYEWYTNGCTVNTLTQPCYETEVMNFTINPGDYMYIVVTYNATSPHGTAWIHDQTNGEYVSMSFDQPPGSAGSAYGGSTAEWIVERPTNISTGQLFDLANYSVPGSYSNEFWTSVGYSDEAQDGYWGGVAYDPASHIYVTVNMVCDPSLWNPFSNCPLQNGFSQYISMATWPFGYTGYMYFNPAGPAATGNN